MKTHFLILFFISFFTVHSLYFGIGAVPQCIYLEQQPATAQNPYDLVVDFFPLNGPPFQLLGWTNKTLINGDSATKICFTSLDQSYKSISIDFYTQDQAHLKQLALKSELYELHNKLIQVGGNLKEISKNEIFQEQRQAIHTEAITQNQNLIKNYALLKIFVIIIVALSQLFLIKNMLSKSSKGYDPIFA